MNRIKSIDGLRAISIIMVLFGHGALTMPKIITDRYLFRMIANGELGVSIFFVISGYLITKLLLAERQKNGRNSLRHFYLRRALRIFPVFYLYLAVVFIIKTCFVPGIVSSNSTFVFAGLYIWNYATFFPSFYPGYNGGWFMGHFWTLAMEEQFYLLWPVAFVWITNRQKLIKTVLAIIILMPVLRLLTYFFIPVARPEIGIMLPTGGDVILTGCLGALLESEPKFTGRYLKYIQNKWLVVSALVYLFILEPILAHYLRGAYQLPLGITISNFCVLLVLFWSIYVPSVIGRALNSRVLVGIGILSYSIYIWQQLILTNRLNWWTNKFPQNFVVVFVVAWLSYNILEKPILRLKNRFKDV